MTTDKRVWKKRAARIGVMMCFAGILAMAMLAQRGGGTIMARVGRVVDGDTLVVRLSRRKPHVRLIGVDTPESAHPAEPVEHFGLEAAVFARSRLDGQTVELVMDRTGDTVDAYGRLPQFVYLDGGELSNAPSSAKATAMRFADSITRCRASLSRSRIRRTFRGGAYGCRVRPGYAERKMLRVFSSGWPRSAPSRAIRTRDIGVDHLLPGSALAW